MKSVLPLALACLTLSAADRPARVTVFSSKDMAMSGFGINRLKVYIDRVGHRLPQNRFFTVELEPGRHFISSGAGALIARREQLTLNLKPGQHVYVLEGLEPGVWRGRLALRRITCEDLEGRGLENKLKPVKNQEGILDEKTFPGCED